MSSRGLFIFLYIRCVFYLISLFFIILFFDISLNFYECIMILFFLETIFMKFIIVSIYKELNNFKSFIDEEKIISSRESIA